MQAAPTTSISAVDMGECLGATWTARRRGTGRGQETEMAKSARRRFLASALPAFGLASPASAQQARDAPSPAQGKTIYRRATTNPPPPYSSELSYGNLVFVSGKGAGAGFQGDIKAQATRVLDQIEESLRAAGSSMDKVLKVNVYLSDVRNFEGMNEVYRPRFAADPPVRTTVGGVFMPDGGLIEIDCIGYI
jgi:enamine deaminase RidA (YjgF/YER057c/UK114 family)